MASECFAVLGLASSRSAWYRAVGLWANSGAVPVDFVKCVSAEEVRARLGSGRPYSALLADAGLPVVDRDLLAEAESMGCAVIVVDDPRARRDWSRVGSVRVLPADFTRDDLVRLLGAHARRVRRGGAPSPVPAGDDPAPGPGAVVAVTGPGGTGASTVAMALAQSLGDDESRGRVLLADLRLHAEMAMLHDAGDVAPGIQELVEAHRMGTPDPSVVAGMVFGVPDRGYLLLLGLRRARHWPVLRPRALEAAVTSLQGCFSTVVCDVDAELEGEAEGGSVDVEERNVMARAACRRAVAVVVVGAATIKGIHSMVRVTEDLVAFGVEPGRIVMVVNRAPRSGRARAAVTSAVGELVAPLSAGVGAMGSPVFLPERDLEDARRDGARLPRSLGAPLVGAIDAALGRMAAEPAPVGPGPELVMAGGYEPVRPGTLGQVDPDGRR